MNNLFYGKRLYIYTSEYLYYLDFYNLKRPRDTEIFCQFHSLNETRRHETFSVFGFLVGRGILNLVSTPRKKQIGWCSSLRIGSLRVRNKVFATWFEEQGWLVIFVLRTISLKSIQREEVPGTWNWVGVGFGMLTGRTLVRP